MRIENPLRISIEQTLAGLQALRRFRSEFTAVKIQFLDLFKPALQFF
jgi:hypothetical protein